ncbi:MAG: DUF4019 domain-containing protein [Polyangiaceae bacterium]
MQSKALFGSLVAWIIGASGCGAAPPEPPAVAPVASEPAAATAVASAPSPAPSPGATVTSSATPMPPAASPDLAGAQGAVQAWLGLVDAGKYGESFRAAATLFRSALTEEAWASSLSNARRPLGQVLTRQRKSASLKTSLPGVPDGKYGLIQFDTAFANKASALETVTAMQEADGTWKVAGYFIR